MSNGSMVWYEINTHDLEKSKGFYGGLFGWEFEEDTMVGRPYTMFKANGHYVGGFSMMAPEHPVGWLVYVNVEDVDAAVEQAKGLGGEVHLEGTEIPKVGRFAIVADPQGAVMAPFKGIEPMGELRQPGIGEIGWHELMTNVDPNEAFGFYAELYGWEKGNVHEMPTGPYLHFKASEVHGGGMMTSPQPGIPPHWIIYVQVEDVAAMVVKVAELGGKVLHGPVEIPMGKFAVCMDAEGGAFAMWQAIPQGE